MTQQYGENGFVPTIENVGREDGRLVFETIDPLVESDIISTKDGLKRRELTDEQEAIEQLRR